MAQNLHCLTNPEGGSNPFWCGSDEAEQEIGAEEKRLESRLLHKSPPLPDRGEG